MNVAVRENTQPSQPTERDSMPNQDDQPNSKASLGKIVISGPGRTFCDVVLAVIDGLTEAGAIVDVQNEYPPEQRHIDLLRDRIKGQRVTVKVDHLPWGG